MSRQVAAEAETAAMWKESASHAPWALQKDIESAR